MPSRLTLKPAPELLLSPMSAPTTKRRATMRSRSTSAATMRGPKAASAPVSPEPPVETDGGGGGIRDSFIRLSLRAQD